MNKEFIPYEQALELKELGFDEGCLDQYGTNCELWGLRVGFIVKNKNLSKGSCSAPLYQQAFRWFREQQEWPIESWIRPFISEQPRSYSAMIWTRGQIIQAGVFSTHDEAQLNLLRKLIEIVKNKQK